MVDYTTRYRNQSGLRKTTPTTPVCYHCQSTEHKMDPCTQLDMRRCFRCGRTGHIGKNCPDYPDKGMYINTILNNINVYTPIFDTGATISLVPDANLLIHATLCSNPLTVRPTHRRPITLNIKGTLCPNWNNGNTFTINDTYATHCTKDNTIIFAIFSLF